MIGALQKRKTPINTRFLGVPYIHLDSKMNIVLHKYKVNFKEVNDLVNSVHYCGSYFNK